MKKKILAKRKRERERLCVLFVIALVALVGVAFSNPRRASALDTGISNLSLLGYINQSVSYALDDDRPDNKDDFNAFIMQALVEAKYDVAPNFQMFGSLKFNADWAYAIYSGKDEWNEKEFDNAQQRLGILYQLRDVIGEAHMTWKPTDAVYFRVGKQIVQWGETDGFLLMNQINPVDQRRGITDVEFENSLIPIWLIRTEYSFSSDSLPVWLQELNIQGLFVPNADFAANESIQLGADYSGIWQPYVETGPIAGYRTTYLGRYRDQLNEPEAWDPQGHAFGLKITSSVADARISLNGYYGRDHEVVRKAIPGAELTPFAADPGTAMLHPYYEAKYPIFKFLGGTFTRDIPSLNVGFLGGVAPVLRFEGLYAFDSTSSSQSGTGGDFWISDEWRGMAGLDWKVRITPLNPKTNFFISPQVFWRHIVDYPSTGHIGTYTGDILYQNSWQTSLMISTSYWSNKLMPSFFWLRDWSGEAEFFRPQLSYEFALDWKATVGAILVHGSKVTQSYEPFDHKDHVYLTLSYKF